MSFFDVKIFNPFSKTSLNMKLDSAFKANETAKKTEYAERIIQIEHGSFTPVVMSAYGGFGVETGRFVATLIDKVAEKRGMYRSVIANYIRTKLSFHLVRSQVLCIRGSRSVILRQSTSEKWRWSRKRPESRAELIN